MSRTWVKANIAEKLKTAKRKISLNREKVILLVILSLIGFILFSSLGGSKTGFFGEQQESPDIQESPETLELPRSNEGGFNISQFGDPPEGFNPPAGAIDDFASGGVGGGIPDIGNPPGIDPPNGEFPGGGGVDPSPGGGGGFNIPNGDPPEPPGGNIDFPNRSDNNQNNSSDNDNERENPFGFPERPNKARNLHNLSSIQLFPNSNVSVNININLPSLPSVGANNLIFAAIVFSLIYLPKSVIARLLEEEGISASAGKDKEGQSVFFSPDQDELARKREEERKKRLVKFGDYINSIINQINAKKQTDHPEDIMIWAYLSLDEAFSKFSGLKRDKSITPLEHAQSSFQSHEINNQALNQIVDLFYRTRFGNKEMNIEAIDNLIAHLEALVIFEEDDTEEEPQSRWSIFR